MFSVASVSAQLFSKLSIFNHFSPLTAS